MYDVKERTSAQTTIVVVAVLALLVCLGLVIGAWRSSEPSVSTGDLTADLQAGVDELRAGETADFSDTVSFDWDDAYFFAPGTLRSDINERVGLQVFESDLEQRVGFLQRGAFAVFVRDGTVVDHGPVPASFEIFEERYSSSGATITKSDNGQLITLSN
jgi:hypothetical protein